MKLFNTVYHVVCKDDEYGLYVVVGLFATETLAIGCGLELKKCGKEDVMVLPLELEGNLASVKDKLYMVTFYDNTSREHVIYGLYTSEKLATIRSRRADNEGYAFVKIIPMKLKGDKKCIEHGSPYDISTKETEYPLILQPMTCSLARQKINHLSLK